MKKNYRVSMKYAMYWSMTLGITILIITKPLFTVVYRIRITQLELYYNP